MKMLRSNKISLFFLLSLLSLSSIKAQCSADVGTFKTYFNGIRVTNFPIYIYPDDEFEILSDNNFSLPPNVVGEASELFIMIFDCQPTFTIDPDLDPCWSSLWWTGKDFYDVNNSSSVITQNFGFGQLIFNTVTVDDGDDNGNNNDAANIDNNGDNCYDYDLSQAVETYWLRDITAVWLNGCNDGTVRIVPSGGLPEFDLNGSKYIVTNNGNGDLSGLPVSHNEAFTITGLDKGDTYDIFITDQEGRFSTTVTGTYTEIDPGLDASIISCDSDAPFALLNELGGSPDNGGVWRDNLGNPISNTYTPGSGGGTFTYTVTHPQNPICEVSSQLEITEYIGTGSTINLNFNFCENESATDLYTLLTGSPDTGGNWIAPSGTSFNGIIDPASAASGIYVYTENVTNPCDGDIFYLEIIIDQLPDAGTGQSLHLCTIDLPRSAIPLLGGTPDNTGTWTAPDGSPFSGTFISGASSGNYTYTVSSNSCPDDQSVLLIDIFQSSDDLYSTTASFCETDAVSDIYNLLNGSPTGGGLWDDPNGNSFNGLLNPATNVSGVYTYDNQSTNPCNLDVYQVDIITSSLPNAGLDATAELCTGNLPEEAFDLLNGTPDLGGAWLKPNGNSFNGRLTDNAVSGVYTYVVSNTPCPDAKATLTASIYQTSDKAYTSDATFCETDGTKDLYNELKGSPSGGSLWFDPNGNSFNGLLNTATGLVGTYEYDNNDPTNPCNFDSYYVDITINPPPYAGENASFQICDNGNTFVAFPLLGGSPDAGGKWTTPGGQGFSGDIDPSLFSSGLYTYTVDVESCPSDNATLDLTIYQSPNILLASVINIEPYTSYQFQTLADNYTSITWTPEDFLDNSTSLTPTISPPPSFETGTYELYLENVNCSATAFTTINVLWPIKPPTGFTPNGDGINDFWEIDYIHLYPDADVTVFNRYGSIVYKGKGADDYWDGTRNGAPLPAGSYYFVIEVSSPKEQKLNGIITIVK